MAKKKKPEIKLYLADPNSTPVDDLKKTAEESDGPPSLVKSILNVLNGPTDSIERLAFDIDPSRVNQHMSVYRAKQRLIPDTILKRVAIQDDLVASILTARANQISAFGVQRKDRFAVGFEIKLNKDYEDQLSEEQKTELNERVKKVTALLLTCGKDTNWKKDDRLTFSQFLFMITRNGLTVGRFAVEAIYNDDVSSGKKVFHSFRPIDAGTIYKATPQKEAEDRIRQQARHILETIKNKDLSPERFQNDEYAWIQVIEGSIYQAFTDKECLVHNLYPVVDIELDGYPLTPIDTAISAITTHINITTHNKLYFQSGRAARGMMVIKSEDIDGGILDKIRAQFNANINNVNNSWRTPIFTVGAQDDVSWMSIDSGGRDMEFQYLSDNNARVILSAFQISPEELPGYAHLCLHYDTSVWTDGGIVTLGELLGDKQEASGFRVWTGKKFVEARAFVTGNKQLCSTTTSNGITVKSSPDHLFRIVDENGNLAWKKQNELKIGEIVLVNRNPIPGTEKSIPAYDGNKLNTEMMEVLGWLTGDGSICVRKKGKTHHSKSIDLYYHHEKEAELLDRHYDILQKFGLNPKIQVRNLSQAAVERQKRVCGFKSVSSIRKHIALYDTKFVEWLLSLGFNPSTDRKSIPAFIHSLPAEFRGAFLRGFFSADGSKDKLDTPSITIADCQTREDTKLLLANMGIRTRVCEGTTRTSFSKKENGEYEKSYKKEASRLIIKDKLEFYNRVGFLQPHKQPNMQKLLLSDRRWDKVAKPVAVSLCNTILNGDFVQGHEERDRIRHALSDSSNAFRVKSGVEKIAKEFGLSLPSWVNEYYQESVIEIERSDESVEMADIEVFDDEHAFIANGVVVHNSRGTNSQALSESNAEFKLEAHRDLGIRPLIAQIETFLNERIFPLLDETLAKICTISLTGLDADTPEKESVRLQQDAPLHMTYDAILQAVEKKPIGKEWAGEFPFNAQYQAILDKYFTVGEILEQFFGRQGASKDPKYQYVRDTFWFENLQLQMQMQQMQAQQQQAQMQAQQQAQGQGQPQEQDQSQDQPQGQQPPQEEQKSQLGDKAEEAMGALGKSEAQLSTTSKMLVAQQRKTIDNIMRQWESDSRRATQEILKLAEHFTPKK